MSRVSFTGYRPAKMGMYNECSSDCISLKTRLAEQIELLYQQGACEFYSGMALGVDTWCAEAVLQLRQQHPEVKLTAVIPCRNQDENWSDSQKLRYHTILSQCDKIHCISENYTNDCMQRRNRALVDLCDILLAVFDGKKGGTKYTVDYAAKKGRKTILIQPYL